MLTYDDALNLIYYKKSTFTGWMNGMRFLIKREESVIKEATEDTPEEKGEPIFHAWIWPGPYIFDLTDDSKKTDNTFPFTDDGKKQCVDWINEVICKWKGIVSLFGVVCQVKIIRRRPYACM